MFLALLLVSNWALVVMYAAPIVRKSTQISPDHRDPAEFWISAELLNIEWKSKCLTTTYCNEPELKVIKTNAVSGEKSSFSWQLNQNFEQVCKAYLIFHNKSDRDGTNGSFVIGLKQIKILNRRLFRNRKTFSALCNRFSWKKSIFELF